MRSVVISGTGLFTPPHTITNEELVESFNAFVRAENAANATAIAAGEMQPLIESDAAFIEKASGVKQRYVMEKEGILDPARMRPNLRKRSNDEPSILTEIAVAAARDALAMANKQPSDIDAVIVACSNLERAYPAIAIEVQKELGCKQGFAFDMNVACSSATFGLKQAYDMVRSGGADTVLIVDPEICSGHLNFRDRDSHFIFGDVATAMIVETKDNATSDTQFEILGAKCVTEFSNNIRNNAGFLNRSEQDFVSTPFDGDRLFVQEGRKVFREVVPLVSAMIAEHLAELEIDPTSLKRMWLHQANIHMNDMIGKKVLGREPTPEEQPNILKDYANTSSAGSIIAFSKHHDGFAPGDTGIICSFGAGYSAGNVVVRKV